MGSLAQLMSTHVVRKGRECRDQHSSPERGGRQGEEPFTPRRGSRSGQNPSGKAMVPQRSPVQDAHLQAGKHSA